MNSNAAWITSSQEGTSDGPVGHRSPRANQILKLRQFAIAPLSFPLLPSGRLIECAERALFATTLHLKGHSSTMAEGGEVAATAGSATPVIEKKDRVRKRVDSPGGEENVSKKPRTDDPSLSLAVPGPPSTSVSASASTASTSTRYDISSQNSVSPGSLWPLHT